MTFQHPVVELLYNLHYMSVIMESLPLSIGVDLLHQVRTLKEHVKYLASRGHYWRREGVGEGVRSGPNNNNNDNDDNNNNDI